MSNQCRLHQWNHIIIIIDIIMDLVSCGNEAREGYDAMYAIV